MFAFKEIAGFCSGGRTVARRAWGGRLGVVLGGLLLLVGGCGDAGGKATPVPSWRGFRLSATEPRPTFGAYVSRSRPVAAQVPPYSLPLDGRAVVNYPELARFLSDQAVDLLAHQGFVVVPAGRGEDMVAPYEDLFAQGVPVLVTVDTLLHLYHIQFDETLKEIEETRFTADLVALTRDLLGRSQAQAAALAGELAEVACCNVAYFAVALKLLDPAARVPSEVQPLVAEELALIEAHGGFAASPLFSYREDYSQYVPRGHYTRSEALSRYFKAMMWYGRIAFLLRPGLVSAEEARRQTLQACLLTSLLYDAAQGEPSAAELWNRIYTVTAFYVGTGDDLTPDEYRQALRMVLGESFTAADLTAAQAIVDIAGMLTHYRRPRIYGGAGMAAVDPPYTAEKLQEVLAQSAGLRFMGQRFVPDSYILQNLVGWPATTRSPFTESWTPAGPIRGLPRGLDVMRILGSSRAAEILEAEGDTAYQGYAEAVAELERELGELTEADWNRNLYWSWLYALQPLLEPVGVGYPTFMQTPAWTDRSLMAALASWTELRHDTILYAKQSYTVGVVSLPPQPVVPGYVEPRPELYARLLALTEMTERGLSDFGVLSGPAATRLQRLAALLERLWDLSVKELQNEALSAEDYGFIRHIGAALEEAVWGVEEVGVKTSLVADVHTDPNSGQVLEEGIGYVQYLWAVFPLPDGRLVLGAGPVLSHYEFKQPLAGRLTDEAWRDLLARGESPPRAPWTASFWVE